MARRSVPRRRTIVTGGAIGALGVALSIAGGPSAQASGNTPTAVQGGFPASAISGTTVFGDIDPTTPETVSFVLTMKGMASLENEVTSGMTSYLTVDQFADRYGQSPAAIKELTDYLAGFGITTEVYANRLNVVASGTAAQFNQALSITQQKIKVPGSNGHPSQIVHAPKGQPMLPQRLASMVTAVLGLSNYAPFSTNSVKAATAASASDAATTSTCPVANARSTYCNLPSDFASRYGVTPMYQQGKTGAGQTIGIVTLAALDEGAPEYFWTNYMHLPSTGRTVTVNNVDGGPGAPSDTAGTGETDLDVEQSGGVAPGANVVVYQAPNTDAGWSDAFFTAATQNTADTVSASWGESETLVNAAIAAGMETAGLQTAYDEAFLELAAQGQSAFVSSGDEGAYDASKDLGTTDLSVDTPGSSPFITSAGGTTLPWSGTLHGSAGTATVSVTKERAWGWDYLWQPLATVKGLPYSTIAKNYISGGGGGYSTTQPRPSYQKSIKGIGQYSAVQYLTPIDYQTVWTSTLPTDWSVTSTPPLVTGSSNGRVEPDVSANADPESGYLLYEPSSPDAVLQVGWGGTSFVAPQFNGATAVINQTVGHRIGFWNPSIYRLAQGSDSPVTPINDQGTMNDNLFYTGTPGTLYNPATGLGTPNLAKFASELK